MRHKPARTLVRGTHKKRPNYYHATLFLNRPNRQVPGGDVRDAGGRFVDAINSSGDAGEDSVCIPGEKKTKVAASK